MTGTETIRIQISSILFTPNLSITIPEYSRLIIPATLLYTASAILCPRLRKEGATLLSVTLRIVGNKIPTPILQRNEPPKTITGDTAPNANTIVINGSSVIKTYRTRREYFSILSANAMNGTWVIAQINASTPISETFPPTLWRTAVFRLFIGATASPINISIRIR